jgi:phosphopantetheinyl transferase
MLTVAPGAPEVKLLDALAARIDEAGLKAWLRAEAVLSGGPHTSRSYRYPYALLTWHTEPLGVDIERIEPFERAFMESICTPSERELLSDDTYPDAFLASLWSSKEALAKALGDALRYDPRRLDSPALWPDGRAGSWRAAELALPAGHSGWLCWRSTLPS